MTRLFSKFVTGSLVAAAFVFSLSLPSQVSAQGHGGQRLQNAQRKERAQIRKDVKNGTITKAQAKNLQKHSAQIQSEIAADRADGKLTPEQARNLKNQTRKEEKAIKGAQDSNKATMPPSQQ